MSPRIPLLGVVVGAVAALENNIHTVVFGGEGRKRRPLPVLNAPMTCKEKKQLFPSFLPSSSFSLMLSFFLSAESFLTLCLSFSLSFHSRAEVLFQCVGRLEKEKQRSEGLFCQPYTFYCMVDAKRLSQLFFHLGRVKSWENKWMKN